MSLIPHAIFPRRMMNLDAWMSPLTTQFPTMGSLMGKQADWLTPTSLDMFDPFDELDTLMSHDIDWLHRPEFLPIQPRVQQKVTQILNINIKKILKLFMIPFF